MIKKTKTITSKSPLPIYVGAATFGIIAMIFPMIKISTILLGLGVSLAVVAGLQMLKVFPDITETIEYEEPEYFANKTVEEIVLEGRKMKASLQDLDEKIEDTEVSALIVSIETTHQAILDYVKNHPNSHSDVRKYMKYYVPSILELLEHYNELEKSQFTGNNATTSKERIVELMKTADVAFKKQLDSLMDQQAMDITVEARVLEDLMSREGLTQK